MYSIRNLYLPFIVGFEACGGVVVITTKVAPVVVESSIRLRCASQNMTPPQPAIRTLFLLSIRLVKRSQSAFALRTIATIKPGSRIQAGRSRMFGPRGRVQRHEASEQGREASEPAFRAFSGLFYFSCFDLF